MEPKCQDRFVLLRPTIPTSTRNLRTDPEGSRKEEYQARPRSRLAFSERKGCFPA